MPPTNSNEAKQSNKTVNISRSKDEVRTYFKKESYSLQFREGQVDGPSNFQEGVFFLIPLALCANCQLSAKLIASHMICGKCETKIITLIVIKMHTKKDIAQPMSECFLLKIGIKVPTRAL